VWQNKPKYENNLIYYTKGIQANFRNKSMLPIILFYSVTIGRSIQRREF
jgi:hypothetical protein